MKRENFVAAIEAIKDQIKKENQLLGLLCDSFNGHLISTFSVNLMQTMIEILESEMDCKDEWVSWWLFDGGREADIGQGVFKIETPGDLFDFLKGDF